MSMKIFGLLVRRKWWHETVLDDHSEIPHVPIWRDNGRVSLLDFPQEGTEHKRLRYFCSSCFGNPHLQTGCLLFWSLTMNTEPVPWERGLGDTDLSRCPSICVGKSVQLRGELLALYLSINLCHFIHFISHKGYVLISISLTAKNVPQLILNFVGKVGRCSSASPNPKTGF